MASDMAIGAFFFGVYLAVPIVLAKLVIRANWTQVGVAYALHLACLAAIGSGGSSVDEQVGWMLIIGMFTTIPAIPILCLVLRIFGFVRRRLA